MVLISAEGYELDPTLYLSKKSIGNLVGNFTPHSANLIFFHFLKRAM